MNTELRNAVLSTDIKAQYDKYAKKLLGHKIILAHILTKSVEEFREISPEEIVPLIEGEPVISKVPIEPGLTNKVLEVDGNEIIGMNTESSEVNEGYILFDIIFYVQLQDGLAQIIINVEAQRKEPTEYDILNRAIFYVSRMISSQKNREFKGSNYNGIKKVYSIWVCMNMREDSLNHIHLTNDNIIGNHKWKGDIRLFNIVMIGLAEETSDKSEKYELHRLLKVLLSDKFEVNQKLDILGNEYRIPMEKSLEEDVKIMCNLSDGIEERAMEAGIELARKVFKLKNQGLSDIQIAEEIQMPVEKVKNVLGE